MINTIKAIPITDVAERLGIDHKNGKTNIPCFKGHDSNTNSLSFNVRDNEFKCFGCGIGGDTLDLVSAKHNIAFKEVIEWFNLNYNISSDYATGKKKTIKDILAEEERSAVVEKPKEVVVKLTDAEIIANAYNAFLAFFKKVGS